MAVWQKGQSGNPAGRPKGDQAITPLLRKLALQKKAGKARAEHVAGVLLALAEGGDIDAIKVVLERLDGKVVSPVDVTSQGEQIKAYVGVDLERV